MAFDKTNAMRNAERYLAQGKIRSAITEYKHVVANDPRDFVTMNMLGDLCAKDNDVNQALKCYRSVAEHYRKQGFAAKAIAVYSKIARIEPDSLEITEKLAELYQMKGSISEAKSHYMVLADHYEHSGQKLQSLGYWKKIAELDRHNTDVLKKLGDSYAKEGETDEAIAAFNLLGARLLAQSKYRDAAEAFEHSLEFNGSGIEALRGYAEAMAALGTSEEATARLEALCTDASYDRDVARLLFNCKVSGGDAEGAERVLLKLAELEPGNHVLFIQLGEMYLAAGDAQSAARALTLCSEHLLVAGKGDDVARLVDDILAADPELVEVLRVKCDLHTWQRNESDLVDALKRLASAARDAGSVLDERFALAQLVMVVPQESEYADRLRELNAENGFDDDPPVSTGFDVLFHKEASANGSGPVIAKQHDPLTGAAAFDYEDLALSEDAVPLEDSPELEASNGAVMLADREDKLLKEIDSIRFYVDNGYIDLAEKAAAELEADHGMLPEIAALREYIRTGGESSVAPVGLDPDISVGAEAVVVEAAEAIDDAPVQDPGIISGSFDLNELRNELGLEDEPDASNDADFETHYNTAIAYQEMGLLEVAINEFQSAAALVAANDGTRRFFQCSNLLGHCFMELGKPHLALTWYTRAIETGGLNDDEKQGLWYEIGNAYEADGDPANAAKYFEMVYAENINFRDVGDRLRKVAVAA